MRIIGVNLLYYVVLFAGPITLVYAGVGFTSLSSGVSLLGYALLTVVSAFGSVLFGVLYVQQRASKDGPRHFRNQIQTPNVG